jgi:endonuclease/exonuclease/phosphatase family metal-dependent hydrolase
MALGALREEARSLDAAAVRERLREIARIGEERGFSGFEPLLFAYQARMANRQDEFGIADARAARAALDAAIPKEAFVFKPSACTHFLQEFWQQWELGHEPTQEQWGRFAACSAEPAPAAQPLQDGLILTVDAGEEFRFVLDRPPGVADGFTATIDPAPASPVVFASDGHQVALYTPVSFELPLSARTQPFTIRLSSGGAVSAYRVVLHVNSSVHGPAYALLVPGQGVRQPYVASGGPDDCGILPPFAAALPCGPVAWRWLGDPLPAGLTLAPWPDGTARLAGAVIAGASSSRGRVRMQQGAQGTEQAVNLQVGVHFAADPGTVLGPHEIVRGQTFRLELPRAFGGDGTGYTWSVEPTSPGLLPSGLQLVQDAGAWRIEGVVGPATPLGETTVRLRVTAPSSSAAASLGVGFRLVVPFRVWTQNTYLRPPTIITTAEIAALLLIPIVGPTLAAAATAIKTIYDNAVKNTDDDNEQRAAVVTERIPDFDIVALQEVFSGANLDQITQGTAGGHWSLAGPEGGSIFDSPGSSGLLLLVRRSLARHLDGTVGPVVRPFAYQLAFAHAMDVYAEKSGNDALSRKGFTLDVVHFGALADEWIYVVNTHTQADPGNEAIRASQLQQVSAFLAGHADARHPVLFMGDFNVPGGTPEHDAMLATLGAKDLFQLVRPNEEGVTYDSERNAYALHWNGDDPPLRQRLDYLLVRQGTDYRIVVDGQHVHVQGDGVNEQVVTRLCRNPDTFEGWTFDDSSLQCYLSDHYGLVGHLRLVRA